MIRTIDIVAFGGGFCVPIDLHCIPRLFCRDTYKIRRRECVGHPKRRVAHKIHVNALHDWIRVIQFII